MLIVFRDLKPENILLHALEPCRVSDTGAWEISAGHERNAVCASGKSCGGTVQGKRSELQGNCQRGKQNLKEEKCPGS